MDHDAITVIARRRVLSHHITANLTLSRARIRAMAPALGPAVARAVDDLAHDIRRGRYDAEAPATLAKRVAETLIQAVATASADATVDDVVASVRAIGGRLAVIKREHLLVGNVARRLLRVIRDEFQHDDDETAAAVAAAAAAAGDGDDATTRTRRMKKDVIDTAHEVIEEMEAACSNIAAQSVDFITNGCRVMTMGTPSAGAGTGLAEAFLREANKRRAFSVVVAESAPGYQGHATAKSLTERGVRDVTVICDSAVYAAMPSVKCCVLSARGVLADGAALVNSGAYNIALAAKTHAVPVIVLAGSYDISPKTREDEGFGRVYGLGSPATALAYGRDRADPDAVVVNPSFEYLPPELISVFVTDHGVHCPGFINVLLAEMYSELDGALLK